MRHVIEFMSTRSQLYDKNQQYEALTRAMTPLPTAKAGEDNSAFLFARPAMACLSCAQFWRPAVDHQDRRRYVGSPIIDKDGRAIGVVCTGSDSENIKDYDGPHTHLMRSLPRWMTPLR